MMPAPAGIGQKRAPSTSLGRGAAGTLQQARIRSACVGPLLGLFDLHIATYVLSSLHVVLSNERPLPVRHPKKL